MDPVQNARYQLERITALSSADVQTVGDRAAINDRLTACMEYLPYTEILDARFRFTRRRCRKYKKQKLLAAA
ncbi:MAG TPA: hypothetical protein VHB93_01085 [Candidatus Paceibacterota bacterium]|nr:hypothetical protein [Candidatus Paceibacterota bacterium]